MRMLCRLPGGGTTANERRYRAEWKKLNSAVERALNVQVTGYDPDISVISSDGRCSCVIPTWVAQIG